MSSNKLNIVLQNAINTLNEKGTSKGSEMVVIGIKHADGNKGPRYFIEGKGDQEFIKMNSNSYLGSNLSL